jgi:hypothetical protein
MMILRDTVDNLSLLLLALSIKLSTVMVGRQRLVKMRNAWLVPFGIPVF